MPDARNAEYASNYGQSAGKTEDHRKEISTKIRILMSPLLLEHLRPMPTQIGS